eukprot:CAMPEP_0171452716 /NCGR_PEP_ID=MMETSP0945-20130129/711_1 /TAXON_ID=109269 /ORGANISM="Vaucheria litorea, Strain CCMP2940" /LENGTH=209 /DNA_ID=CAMNT_0011977435 /DNA_START=48 /DNA_END=674 /DNA_ORIENTATION=-
MSVPVGMWEEFIDRRREPEYLRNVIIGMSSVMAVLTIPLLICSFSVAETANAGFNVVFTGFMLIGWEIGTIMLMQRGPTALSYGFFTGSSLMMTVVTLLTSIYWGQLSQCDSTYNDILSQFTCTHTGGMGGVCAFSVLVWLVQIPFMALIFSQKETIVGMGMGLDDENYPSDDFYRYSFKQNASGSQHSSGRGGRREPVGIEISPPVYD